MVKQIKKFIDTEEGILDWVSEKYLLNREYTKTYTEMMKHDMNTPDPEERIVIGIGWKRKQQIKNGLDNIGKF